MRIRGITKEEIVDAVNNPNKELDDPVGNIIAHKLKNNYLLRVFYFNKEGSKIIITAYKTSKLDKYL
jgi:hypothetical protein